MIDLLVLILMTPAVFFIVHYISRYLVSNRVALTKNKKIDIPFYYILLPIFIILIESIVYWNFGYSIDSIFYLLFFILLFIAAIVDFQLRLIPNELSVVGVLLALLYLLFRDDISALNAISTAIISILFLSLVSLIFYRLHRKSGIGFGDIKLLLFTSLFLGFTTFFTVMALSFLLTSIVTISLALTSKQENLLSQELAFAPSLFVVVLGYFGVLLF